jgi:Flp pilus assembly protein TadD
MTLRPSHSLFSHKEKTMNAFTKCLALAAAAALPLFASGADFGAPTTPVARSAPVDHLAAGRKAIEAKDWNRAITELNAAERDDPRNADVHNLLGYSYRKRVNPDLPKAFEHYNTALKIDPNNRGIHEYIGEAYLMDRKPAEAEKHLAELEKICGRGCEEYGELAKSIADYKAKN